MFKHMHELSKGELAFIPSLPRNVFLFCLAQTGLARSPCNHDRECKAGLYCSYNDFDGGRCVQLRKEGERCNKGMFSRRPPKCAKGLECKATR